MNPETKPQKAIRKISERPDEKFRTLGSVFVSNAELLSLLIQHGMGRKSALEMGQELLDHCSQSLAELGRLNIRDLMKVKGIGISKALAIAAAMELGRRRMAEPPVRKQQIKGSDDIGRYLQHKFQDLRYEVFAVVFLNQAHRIIHFAIISSGGLTGTVVDIRIILRKALEEEATSLILCHNHPSGNLQPSLPDQELTKKIREAAKYFDIKILDHLIVGSEGYFSFADKGLL